MSMIPNFSMDRGNMAQRSLSHKGEKVCSYTVAFKLEVVRYAELSSNHAAGRRYNVSRSSVRDWRKKKTKLEEMMMQTSICGAHRRRLSGGGRKIVDSRTEKNLVEWIIERKQQGINISGAQIIKKAQSLQREKADNTNMLTYSRGWLEKFMKRNGLSLKNVQNQSLLRLLHQQPSPTHPEPEQPTLPHHPHLLEPDPLPVLNYTGQYHRDFSDPNGSMKLNSAPTYNFWRS